MAHEQDQIFEQGAWMARYLADAGVVTAEALLHRADAAEYSDFRARHLRKVAEHLIARRDALDELVCRTFEVAGQLDLCNAANAELSLRLKACEDLIVLIEQITRPYGSSMWRACVEDVLHNRSERCIGTAVEIVRVIERGLRFDNLSKILIERRGLH